MPAKHEGAGFPPFKTDDVPQPVLLAGDHVRVPVRGAVAGGGAAHQGAITTRRGPINGAIAEAQKARGDAEAASAAYQAALAAARTRAKALAEETRQTLNAEIAKAKAEADASRRPPSPRPTPASQRRAAKRRRMS